ncbi:hypothetical protein [Pedobacter chitinilyticus]|uniref:DUF4249 family protein n=1 Tax=Pedobacter chitinilyticus TaxID=2233776 RepID=A0A3S3PCL9_9SPHI|nr:hypothetical protein [Pedobacter chitinilyticus]RWU08642.1 hypothetical protein DPV69_09755 [Pedobacter chitinilyticus]
MKKLTLLLLCVATLGLASCKKDTIVGPNNLTIIKYIEANQWQLSNDGLTYSATINEPSINRRTFENDGILVYVSRGNTDFYEQLPFVYNVDAYSYSVTPGSLTIDVQSSDNQDFQPIKPTGRTRVKIVLVESFQ